MSILILKNSIEIKYIIKQNTNLAKQLQFISKEVDKELVKFKTKFIGKKRYTIDNNFNGI